MSQPSRTHHGRARGLRPDLAEIARWVPKGSRVLDLGCGDGSLMAWLARHKDCTGYGVEIDHDKVLTCLRSGVQVIQADIDEGLSMFRAAHFDVVVLSQALQATHQTEGVLREISRLGRQVIVSIPNFGHWSHLWSLACGHMPVNKRLPYQWYDTPNLHFATIRDFEALLDQMGLRVLSRKFLAETAEGVHRIHWAATLRSTLALYRFQARLSPASGQNREGETL